MEQQTYTIREMSERFGLPASTLRYYEEIGLLTDVIHTESKKRIYTQQHIDCMTAILCFKRTGLPIAGIQEFFRLEDDIPGNIDQMVAILEEHEQNIRKNRAPWNLIWSIFKAESAVLQCGSQCE